MEHVDGTQEFEMGTHPATVQAVYNNSVSGAAKPVFATVYKDARLAIAGDHPDVFDHVRVLAESPAIPNDVVVFGPDFPAKLRRQIEKALVEMADPDSLFYPVWEASVGELYSSTGLDKAKNKDFRFLRTALEAADL